MLYLNPSSHLPFVPSSAVPPVVSTCDQPVNAGGKVGVIVTFFYDAYGVPDQVRFECVCPIYMHQREPAGICFECFTIGLQCRSCCRWSWRFRLILKKSNEVVLLSVSFFVAASATLLPAVFCAGLTHKRGALHGAGWQLLRLLYRRWHSRAPRRHHKHCQKANNRQPDCHRECPMLGHSMALHYVLRK